METLRKRHPVDRLIVLIGIIRLNGLTIKDYSSHHHTLLAQKHGQGTGVDACDARYSLADEPVDNHR